MVCRGPYQRMAFALQPVVNVGIQILLNIAIGWLLVASRAVDGDKYMPQVGALPVCVGFVAHTNCVWYVALAMLRSTFAFTRCASTVTL